MFTLAQLALCLLEVPARGFEKKHLHSDVEVSIAWRTYLFLVINMLALPSFALDADAASTLVERVIHGGKGASQLLPKTKQKRL